jgi:hypothetical protein
MKKVLCVVALLAVTSAAYALPVVNGDWGTGDETAWTRWRAPWGAGETWAVTNNGPTPPEGSLSTSQSGSFGWYQRVPVIESETYQLVADWAGNVTAPGWAEIGVIMGTDAMDDAAVVGAIDGGQGIIAKKDGWGLNPPAQWGWEPISLALVNPDTFHATSGEVAVFIKLGANPGSVQLSVDNIELLPEPATALLLGLPILFLRRRR